MSLNFIIFRLKNGLQSNAVLVSNTLLTSHKSTALQPQRAIKDQFK
ncbi:MAG: hypothetical protein ACI9C4_001675 [Paraglaciecola sp.]|jgi:hypothetical protein